MRHLSSESDMSALPGKVKSRLPSRLTEKLADFAINTQWASLPDAVIDKVLLHIVDSVGCAAAGSTLPWTKQVCEYARRTGRDGAATVIGGPRLVAEWAAFVNATAIHGFELDDYHTGALAHPGCVVVPAVLAIGEGLQCSGQDIVLACAVGFETVIRLGLALGSSMVVERGFHETCIEGVFGAAVGAGRLLGLSPDKMVSALGIAGSHASGTREYSHSGGEAKRLHAGLGAMGGIRAVMLSDSGFQGPTQILEGDCGIFQTFADHYSADAMTADLGSTWHLLGCGLKPYANCGLIHAPIEGLRHLMKEHGLTPDNIDEIEIGVDRLSLEHCGSLPIPPVDMNGAQFNLPYSLGMTVAMGGNGFTQYWSLQRHGFAHPGVIAAASKVRLKIDKEVDAAFPGTFMSRVRVRRKDGAWYECIAKARGSGQDPLTPGDVRAKFVELLGHTRWSANASDVMAAINGLRAGGRVSDVMNQFTI